MGAISSEAARASLALFSPSVAKLSCVASSAPQRGGVFVCGGRGDRPLTDGFGASRQRGGGKEGAAAMSTALLVVGGGGDGRVGAEPLYATARHNKGEKGRGRIIAVKVPKLSVE